VLLGSEIETCSQFHQHFYIQIFCTNVVSAAFSSYVPALAPQFCTKNARVNVDEIDTCSAVGIMRHEAFEKISLMELQRRVAERSKQFTKGLQ